MSFPGSPPDADLRGLLTRPAGEVRGRLGPPDLERRVGPDRWLVYRRGTLSVRVRCRTMRGEDGTMEERDRAQRAGAPAEPEERVASWTASFAQSLPSLRAAAERVGLWPEIAPDETPAGDVPMLRRPLPDPESGAVHSLTAGVRDGRIFQLTAFDEPPEWLEGFQELEEPL